MWIVINLYGLKVTYYLFIFKRIIVVQVSLGQELIPIRL